jgi:peroxiredoxin
MRKLFGVSKDSVRVHANFAKKHDLNFTLLSDRITKSSKHSDLGVKKSSWDAFS